MSLFVVDHILSYQDGNDLKTMQSSATALASPGTAELQMYTASSKLSMRRFNGASWDKIGLARDANGHAYLIDNEKLYFGTGNDLSIYHDGTDSYLTNITGDLRLSVANDVRIDADGKKLTFGASEGLQIYHGGTFAFMQNTIGDFLLYNTGVGKDFIFRGVDSSSNVGQIWFDPDFAGTGSGNLSLRMKYDNSKLTLGAGDDLQLYHDGTNSYIKNLTGDLILDVANDVLINADNKKLSIGAGEDLQLYHDGTYSWITESAHILKILGGTGLELLSTTLVTIDGTTGVLINPTNGAVTITSPAFFDIDMNIGANGNLNISGLPTASGGLSTGDVWSNGGVLTIV